MCACVCARARGHACARVSAQGRSARSAIDYRTSAARAGSRAHSLAPTRAPGSAAPSLAAPELQAPHPSLAPPPFQRGAQVTRLLDCFRDLHALPTPTHNKAHVCGRLGRKDWNGEGTFISAAGSFLSDWDWGEGDRVGGAGDPGCRRGAPGLTSRLEWGRARGPTHLGFAIDLAERESKAAPGDQHCQPETRGSSGRAREENPALGGKLNC